jgi:hypothetical protein
VFGKDSIYQLQIPFTFGGLSIWRYVKFIAAIKFAKKNGCWIILIRLIKNVLKTCNPYTTGKAEI